jgi:cell wall-associated NlpC family hydrolase
VAEHNARMRRSDPSLHDLERLPATWPAARVREAIDAVSRRPQAPRVDAMGRALTDADWARWQHALALEHLPAEVPVRFALVTRRASLRSVPTETPAYAADGDRDLDRFQETALFPGTPVAVLHASRDGAWRFVRSETYAAWMPTDALAEGPREAVLDYTRRARRVITGATARLAASPEAPALSGLVLDMGTALPERIALPDDLTVNGQGAAGAHVVELPTRDAEGKLRIAPALLPRHESSHRGPLPASRAVVLQQAFRFLGERYGWGHAHGARDCSGFVAEVYRSLGLLLPRNTGDQARSPVLAREPLEGLDRAARRAAVAALAPGDLLYLPGHVVMVVGHDAAGPWVIHDVHRLRTRRPDGRLQAWPANGVVLTPLLPLQFDETRDYLDAATVLVRVLPPS